MSGVWLIAAALGAATPQTGNADVDAFVADIAAGRREAALARVYEMNSLSGEPNAVATAEEFVGKLVQCTYVSVEPRTYGFVMYDVRWRCPDGDYYAVLDPGYRPPRLVVFEFLSAAAREERRRRPPTAPPPVSPVQRPSDG